MKKANEKLKFIVIILVTLSISLFLKLNPSYTVSSDFKIRMYSDFKSYKEQMESLNDKLVSIIIVNERDLNKLLLNDEALNNFVKSKYDAARIGKYSLHSDYVDIYQRYNENIEYILEDRFINESEQAYIHTLYDYNVEC